MKCPRCIKGTVLKGTCINCSFDVAKVEPLDIPAYERALPGSRGPKTGVVKL